MCKEAVIVNYETIALIFLEELRKTVQILSRYMLSPGRNLNPAFPNTKQKYLTLDNDLRY